MGRKCTAGCGVCGLVLGLLGALSLTLFHLVVKFELGKLMPLKVGTFAYPYWKKAPIPVYMQFYVFDVINSDEVIETGAKPSVLERGPYTYRLEKEKVGIKYNDNNTVTYRQITWYYFERNMSVGYDNETFTNFNIPYLSVAYLVRFEYPWVQELINYALAITGENLFKVVSVHDILYGYEDPLLKFVSQDIMGLFNMSHFLDPNFGLMYKWNGSDDGVYNVYTGSDDIFRAGFIDKWNYFKTLSFWSGKYANMINGSDGEFFGPFVDSSKDMLFYSSQACRSLLVKYQYTHSIKGIDVYRYLLPADTFACPAEKPDNVGFCSPDSNHCMASGVLNVSVCRNGSSGTLSFPHFLGADPDVIHGVDGLHPNSEQHSSFIDIEPTTGLPFQMVFRFQVGIHITNNSIIKGLHNIRSLHMPIVWFNESAYIDDDLANKFKARLELPMNIVHVMQIILIIMGSLILIGSAIRWFRKYKTVENDTEEKPLFTPVSLKND
ncbi:platelet glycoprotein 4-like [Gigantopelta aegis]|uniref:platelet glycoprotein 4-like n=1 Tax=Gigantopelta aegis TaxID=1735272 RepID=UPI001B88ABB5|nr:platelet glycoprotein 4-like [Gigantopelta aegis]